MDKRLRYYGIDCADDRQALSTLEHLGHNGVKAEVFEDRFVIIGPTAFPGHYFANGGPLYEADSRPGVITRLCAAEGIPVPPEARATVAVTGSALTFDVRPLAEMLAESAYQIVLTAGGVDMAKMPAAERERWERHAAAVLRYMLDLVKDEMHQLMGPTGCPRCGYLDDAGPKTGGKV